MPSTTPSSRRSRAPAFAAVALLAACGGDPPPAATPVAGPKPTAPAEASAGAAPDPAVVEAQQKMVPAVTVGDASAPVELRFDLAAAPKPGEPFTVEFAVLPQTAMLSIRGAVTGSAGLEVVSPVGGVSFEKLQAGTVHRFQVTALSDRPGTRVVNVAMTIELPTGPVTRTFGVPVVVGSPAGA